MRNIIFAFSLLSVCCFSSCDKWLDVKPDQEVYSNEALKNRQGFSQALSGLYASLGVPELYGRNLEFGLMDALAGYWKIGPSSDYYYAHRFDYKNITVQSKIDSIWGGLYKGIHESNLILENVDNIKNDAYYSLIKGEALGLRAFLHLELFKIFGPVVSQQGLGTPAIPYYTQSTKVPHSFLTSQDVLDLIESDLQDAKGLLSNDPIISNGREGDGNTGSVLDYNSLIDRRGIRMNYYAVQALLARKSQWEGNLTEAAARAQSLLDELKVSKAIRFMEPNELENIFTNKDVRFSKENLWGLFVDDINNLTRVHFESGNRKNNTALSPDYKPFLENLYVSGSGSSLDFRLNIWNINSDFFSKFNTPQAVLDNRDLEQAHFYEVQLINLPELYFILAEANLHVDLQKSIEYINAVRKSRKLPDLIYETGTRTEEVKKYLIDEVRREYIGEGYLFTFYKRLFNPIYRSSGTIEPNENVFVFPIPNAELIYNTSK